MYNPAGAASRMPFAQYFVFYYINQMWLSLSLSFHFFFFRLLLRARHRKSSFVKLIFNIARKEWTAMDGEERKRKKKEANEMKTEGCWVKR